MLQLQLLTTLVISCCTPSAAAYLYAISGGGKDGIRVYRVNTVGPTEQVSAGPPTTALNSTTFSRWQSNEYFSDDGHYVKLSQTYLLVVLNGTGTLTQIPLPSECLPSHIVRATGRSFHVFCRPSARDGWRSKYQPAVLNADGRCELEALQYGTGTACLPSEYNSAIVGNGRGGHGLVSIADNTIRWLDTTSLTPSAIDVPTGCTTLTSVGSLEPTTDGKYRFTLGCSQDAVKKRYIVDVNDQSGSVDFPAPLASCDSPPVAVPGGRYVLGFCDSFNYIMDLTASTKKYVLITMGAVDQLVFVPNGLIAIVTLNEDITIMDPALEYQVAGTSRRKIPNTASASLRPNSVTQDGMLMSCATDETKNWCKIFNISSTANVTNIATFSLATIQPYAAIVEGGDAIPAMPGGFPSHVATPVVSRDANLAFHWPVVLGSMLGVVIAVVVLVVVVVVVLMKVKSLRSRKIRAPLDAHESPPLRRAGNGAESSKSDNTSNGDGCSNDCSFPPYGPQQSPQSVMVTGQNNYKV